jgi:hypothetical protein
VIFLNFEELENFLKLAIDWPVFELEPSCTSSQFAVTILQD